MAETEYDIIDNGMTKVVILEDVGNPNAPTVAELNDALEVTWQLTTDGLIGFEPETGDVDAGSLGSKNSSTLPGRPTYSGVGLRFKKQSEEDAAYALLQFDTRVRVAVRRDQDNEEPFAVGDEVQMVPFACGETRRLMPEGDGNGLSRFEVPGKVFGRVYPRAVVVAGGGG